MLVALQRYTTGLPLCRPSSPVHCREPAYTSFLPLRRQTDAVRATAGWNPWTRWIDLPHQPPVSFALSHLAAPFADIRRFRISRPTLRLQRQISQAIPPTYHLLSSRPKGSTIARNPGCCEELFCSCLRSRFLLSPSCLVCLLARHISDHQLTQLHELLHLVFVDLLEDLQRLHSADWAACLRLKCLDHCLFRSHLLAL